MARARAIPTGPPAGESAARRLPTPLQSLALAALATGATVLGVASPARLFGLLHDLAFAGFAMVVAWRFAALFLARPAAPVPPAPLGRRLPRYTVVAALRDEAAMLPQLVARLDALDYPRDRLQGLLVLEPDDPATLAAARACRLPSWVRVVVAPVGRPATKPRALNVALAQATGELLVIYDAEDAPHPGQLREAAARFAHGGSRLGCLQAPLRVRGASRSIGRQFAAEYAALYEVTLPALVRAGLPFPLGGTSNHLRTEALRAVGGWDPFNVTEDADLGFRLHRRGWRLGLLTLPTWEPPPEDLGAWLPQRARWLKGYMQTWGVHMRRPQDLGLRGVVALQLTLGQAIASACVQAPVVGWLAAMAAIALAQGVTPAAPLADVGLALAGWAVATAACVVGARRAGIEARPGDLLAAPLYWSLLTLAQGHAAWRLLARPFHWDKTAHAPDAAAGRDAAAAAMARPWPPVPPRRPRRFALAAGRITPSSIPATGESSSDTGVSSS